MATLKFDLSKNAAPIRPMSCVNNRPVHKRHANDQSTGGTFLPYKAARIPYARNHDALRRRQGASRAGRGKSCRYHFEMRYK